MIGSTSVRASRAAAGESVKKDALTSLIKLSGNSRGEPPDEIHLVCDAGGMPLATCLSVGQHHDTAQLKPLM